MNHEINSPLRVLTALILSAALFLGLMPMGMAASVVGFTDVSAGDWYYDSVAFVVGRGLFQGTSSTQFSPHVTATRGMFITVLGRYAGVNEAMWRTGTIVIDGAELRVGADPSSAVLAVMARGGSVTILAKENGWYRVKSGSDTGYVLAEYLKPDHHAFSDIGYDQYYAGYAIWAYENGIITGDGGPDKFSPLGYVTREQVCTVLGRFAIARGIQLAQTMKPVSFSDDSTISAWAKENVYAMQRCGVVNGKDGGKFDPHAFTTRAELAVMLHRFDAASNGFTVVVTPDPGATTVPSPTAVPEATPSAAPSSTPDPGEELTTPSPTPTADQLPPDTPVQLIDTPITTKASVIRVGIMIDTGSMQNSVKTATLTNLSGGGFEFGSMSDRHFVSAGVSTAENTISVSFDGSAFTVTDTAGGNVYTSTGTFAIHPTGGRVITSVGNYSYYGDFEIRQAAYTTGNVAVINYVSVEDYVKGVLPYEFGNYWPTEALKAAAIAVRTYIMSYNWNTFSSYGADVVSGTGTQIYWGKGQGGGTYCADSDAAADATAGIYLTYNGQFCVTAYSSCNGGRIKSSSEAGWGKVDYLVGKDDPYDKEAIKYLGDSYQTWVDASHHVGMSANGSRVMAVEYGKDYRSILGFYFPGTTLQRGA